MGNAFRRTLACGLSKICSKLEKNFQRYSDDSCIFLLAARTTRTTNVKSADTHHTRRPFPFPRAINITVAISISPNPFLVAFKLR